LIAAALSVLMLVRRPIRFGLGVAALLAVSFLVAGEELRPLHIERSFFGVLTVKYRSNYDAHQLSHGSTNHGMQSLKAEHRGEPWTYYHRRGPVGQAFRAREDRGQVDQVGVIGLGTGAIAAYGEPGRRIVYYEIDPAVERIAWNPEYFTYLADSASEIEVVRGDARLSLTATPYRQFDLLFVDAFSSDSIPVHLLTREAMQLYLENLAEEGVLMIHISNRYMDLEPVVAALADDADLAARVCDDRSEKQKGKFGSTGGARARREADLGGIATDDDWQTLARRDDLRTWTDSYSNIVAIMDWDVREMLDDLFK